MIKVMWDDTLPPNKIQTPVEVDIARWDMWFEAVGMTKEWVVAKEQLPDDVDKQLMWAKIMELNRLSAVTREKAEQTM